MFIGGGAGRERMMFGVEASKPQNIGVTLARFWQYFKRFKLPLLGVAVLILLSTYMQVLTPDLIGQAVDCYITPATLKGLSASGGAPASGFGSSAQTNCWYAQVGPNATSADYIAGLGGLIALIVGLQVAGALLGGSQFFLMTFAGQSVLRNIRIDVFKHLHRLSLGYFTKHEASDVMSRIPNDADTI